MSTELVKAFNALPRKEKAPSGMVANEWHFDVRYVPLEPTPSHIVVLIQTQSKFIHIERLPVGLPAGSSGIAFFPESGKEAAPEVAKALLHAFVNNMGQNEMMGSRALPAFAPWKLTTEDRDLATAVGAEFKRLGVRANELCKIALSKPSVNRIMDARFDGLYKSLKNAAGYTGVAAAAISTPEPIMFWNFKVDRPRDVGDASGFDLPLKYVQQLYNSRPPSAVELDTKTMIANARDEMLVLQQTAFKKPEAVIKAEADQGDAEAALDYGLRLYIGLGCKRNRSLSRVYLVKVVSSPSASDTLKATAHGMLIDWCVQASLTDFRSRYLLAASHHANLAAALCRRVTPPGTHSSAAVLWFMKNVFQRQAVDCPQLYVFYKDAMRALDERDAQLKGSREKMQQKRLKNPNRYRCAAAGCGVQADTGKMLSQCSGQCDPDKKPSYCSKECQKADWKNHKPFCLPGAECSVIDDGTTSHEIATDAGPASKSGSGAIQLPITHANGSKTFVSSSTLDAQMLKEIRDLAGNRELSGVPSSLTVEMERVTL